MSEKKDVTFSPYSVIRNRVREVRPLDEEEKKKLCHALSVLPRQKTELVFCLIQQHSILNAGVATFGGKTAVAYDGTTTQPSERKEGTPATVVDVSYNIGNLPDECLAILQAYLQLDSNIGH